MTEAFEHFLKLARRGQHAAASGGEVRAAKLAVMAVNEAPGLDYLATMGLLEFIQFCQSHPQEARMLFGLEDHDDDDEE